MTAISSRYAIVLWLLATLFLLRVVGQLLVALFDVPLLPPMEAWFSGLLPYPVLLATQGAILAVQLKIGIDFTRGSGFFVVPRRRLGRVLRWFSYVYFASMLARYVVTRSLIIPVFFHWVLAAYLFALGHYHTRSDLAGTRGRAAGGSLA